MLFFITACTEPPIEAPAEMNTLCSFLYNHFADDDPTPLIEGVQNLNIWLADDEHFTSIQEGFSIQPLSEEVRYNISNTERPIVGTMIGVSLAHEVTQDATNIARGLFVEDWSVISGNYTEYERTFSKEPDCLLTQSCTWLEYDIDSTSSWVGGLMTGTSSTHGQVRWIETDSGWVLLQRFWLLSPMEISPDLGLKIFNQYYLHITIPTEQGAMRSQALWMDGNYEEGIFDEEWGKSQTISSIQQENDALIDWLENDINGNND